jgi:hypothetical protein
MPSPKADPPRDLKLAMDLVAQFERDVTIEGEDVELLLIKIFDACGFPVRRRVRWQSGQGIPEVIIFSTLQAH